jgi:uncharacterized Zn finger protein
MEVLARPHTGLFPTPKEITFSCSCPDWASMCKHVAAALYGVGARLDQCPELFFTLRQVDERELVIRATSARALTAPAASDRLGTDELGAIFGIDLAGEGRSAPRKRGLNAGAKSNKEKPPAQPARTQRQRKKARIRPR